MSLPNNSKRKVFDGRYEILSIVGRGADSVVYHGRHITGAAQEVAIKVLINRDGSTTLTDKLRREALTLVSCRHRYVVRLDDFHSIQDLCYLSMEFAPHGDLNKYIASQPDKRLSPDQVETFLRQSLEAIDFVHATGVVHRDLKPENILVLNEKEIRIADFGLALLPGDDIQLEELRKAVGSFDYLAPEVLDGIRYDSVSDLYSLGVCFYEAACGRHPFAHAPIAARRDARRDSNITPLSQLNPALPPHLAAVIQSLMLFSATDRFQSASDALRALGDKSFKGLLKETESRDSQVEGVAANSDVAEQNRATQNGAAIVSEGVSAPDKSVAAEESNGKKYAASNSDIIDASQGPKQSTPTEKIDLERVKEIIARDSQRRANSDASDRSGSHEDSRKTSEYLANPMALPTSRTKTSIAKKQSGKIPNSKVRIDGLGAGSIAPLLGRFVGVALAFALLTIGGLYGYSAVFSSGDKTQMAKQQSDYSNSDSNQDVVDEDTELSTAGEPAPSLLALPEGVYIGAVAGLFPDNKTPLALISNPERHTLTLLVGADGWAPVTISTSPTGDPETEGPTFRSNGLILRFNQESSSSKITGTVIDVVTGEAGTWQVAK
jgi:serine/threonine protein kinase